MGELHGDHIAKIERQSLEDLERAYRQLCGMEVDLESRLESIREIKARILITIELKLNEKK